MAIQRLSRADVTILENPGFRSEQIVWPGNAPDARATITRVTMQPGAVSTRHVHATSEQIWIVEQGTAIFLTEGDAAEALAAGDVVRTPAGAVHGVSNTGSGPFVYLAVTTPPQDFTPAYRGRDTSA